MSRIFGEGIGLPTLIALINYPLGAAINILTSVVTDQLTNILGDLGLGSFFNLIPLDFLNIEIPLFDQIVDIGNLSFMIGL